jgi:hypothetical protein
MDHDISIIVFSVLIIFLSCLIGASNHDFTSKFELPTENFVDEVQVYDPDENVIQSERLIYFKIGLANFFTQQDKLTSLTMPKFLSIIKQNVYMWPNYQDLCCKALEKGDSNLDCSCNNINIRNTSCFDTKTAIMNEKSVDTIEASLGASKQENCTISVLGNDYFFVKRSVLLNIQNIDMIGLSSKKQFRLTLGGNVSSIVFTRPLFISFNVHGLYKVVHQDVDKTSRLDEYENKKESNMFAFYDSSKHDTNVMYLEKIHHNPENDIIVYNETSSTIKAFEKQKKKDYSATLYYMNYKSEIKVYDANTNVLNIIINEKTYNDTFLRSSTLVIITQKDNSDFIYTIQIEKNNDGKVHVVIYEETDKVKTFNIPDEFLYYDPSHFEKFDICITFSYDILMINCWGIRQDTRVTEGFSVRYHLSKKLEIKKELARTTLQEQAPQILYYMNNTLKDVMNFTCIPNYSRLMNVMGYVL